MRILSRKLAIGLPNCYVVFCPACKCLHRFYVTTPEPNNGSQWTFDDSFGKPTFSPSLIVTVGGKKCHSFLMAGQWMYLEDSEHDLAGKTVDLPDLPDWIFKEYS